MVLIGPSDMVTSWEGTTKVSCEKKQTLSMIMRKNTEAAHAQQPLQAADMRVGIEEHFESREFQKQGQGAAWEVKRYSHPHTDALQKRYLVKRLKGYPLVKEYRLEELDENDEIKPPRDEKVVRKAADRLRREQGYLKRLYGAELPGLIPQQKIMPIAPKKEGQVGEVIAVQEWIWGYQRLDQILPYLQGRYEGEDLENKYEKLREQVESFVNITKYLFTREDEDPDFSHAIPDISHLSNLVVDVQDGKLDLKLVDTNFVVPVDDEEFQGYRFATKARYWLIYMEHHFLGRSLKELSKDPFYKDDPDKVLKRTRKYLKKVPSGSAKRILYELRLISAKQAGVKEERSPFLEQIERVFDNVAAFVKEEETRLKRDDEPVQEEVPKTEPVPVTILRPKQKVA
jgi:hypothetical protein